MNTELFLFIDIVKSALLRRMAREVSMVLTDTFLSAERQAQAAVLYERIGNNFVTYIASLHKVKTPELLFVLAGNAVKVYQDSLDKAWTYSYDGHCELIDWLPVPDAAEEILNDL